MAARERYKVNQWYGAPTRKGRRHDNKRSNQSQNQGTKYFVSNLPNGCSSADLIGVLKGFGDIIGTYIARKLDRLGKRFGFVSFRNVRDPLELERQLKDVWIGSYKLFIVLARFVDGERIMRNDEKQWQPVYKDDMRSHEGQDMAGRDEGRVEKEPSKVVQGVGNRSFLDTLLNKEVNTAVPEVTVDENIVALNDLFEKGVVVRVKEFAMLTDMKKILKEVSDLDIEINYIGGFYVMLVFRGGIERSLFLAGKESWTGYFECAEPWNGQIIDFERIAWIKIFGIPLHLSCKDVMDSIAGSVGLVIQSTEFLEGGKDLSYGCVGVLVKSVERINKQVMLKWREMKFEVLVEEDVGEWSPECLFDLEEEARIPMMDELMVEEVQAEEVHEVEQAVDNSQVVADKVVQEHASEGLGLEDGTFGLGNEGVKIKKKGRKFSRRRKSSGSRNGSPSGQERPKKRCREREDVFDLDHLISVVNSPLEVSDEGIRDRSEVRFNLDLNSEEVSADNKISEDQIVTSGVNVEVGETIELAKVLGAENMEAFRDSLVKSVSEEGFQQVDQ